MSVAPLPDALDLGRAADIIPVVRFLMPTALAGGRAGLGACSRVARYRDLGRVGNAALGSSYICALLGGDAMLLLNPHSLTAPQL